MTQTTPFANNIPLDGFYNLRDGGDMPTATGKVRARRLLRSDAPAALSATATEFFRELPLEAVIDLRTDEEVEGSVHPFTAAGYNVEHIPVFSGSIQSMMEDTPDLSSLYLKMVTESGPQLAKAIGAISDGVQNGAVDVHCTAGKDRTGVVIALTQSLLGVPRDDIIDNYTATQANLSGAWLDQMMARYAGKLGISPENLQKAAGDMGLQMDEIREIATGSPASAIEAMLEAVDQKHGGVKDFLVSNGLTEEKIQALIGALTVPNSQG